MRGLEWDDMEVKVDARHLHHLRFVLTTSSINQAQRMLAGHDDVCVSRSRNQHDERPDLRAAQKETNGLGNIQEHREFTIVGVWQAEAKSDQRHRRRN
ncbi:hypothetical protein RB195_011751 [Necator americanus]|uniref:Uncharacterized protein n=1 Tax=Necator americanus TaxID=51031 RepID=A0ABR1D4X9_NECAM